MKKEHLLYQFRELGERRRSRQRVVWLFKSTYDRLNTTEQPETIGVPESIDETLLRSGYLTTSSRGQAQQLKAALTVGFGLAGLLIGIITSSSLATIILVALAGITLGNLTWFLYLSILNRLEEQRALLELPIILESLILLVESGLGLLPALEKIVAHGETIPSTSRYLFRLAHEMSMRGVPISEALQRVSTKSPFRSLKHVFLHLEIAATDGGALVPALRGLAHYAHTEWKLSVETRVRRLENLVVFPVFGAVIGLVLLAAAVPILPLLELGERLDSETYGANYE